MKLKPYSIAAGVIVGLTGLVGAACMSMDLPTTDARLQRFEASPQYRDGRFVNPRPVRNGLDGEGHVSWNLARRWLTGNEVRVPEQALPALQCQRADFARPAHDGLRLTWLGHSTVLIEIDGYRVLTDPLWASSVSPFSFHGSQRFSAPPLALSELPDLDAVLVSHDHYDHLDRTAIVFLFNNTAAMLIVPLGIGARLERWGVATERIVELDWWQQHTLGGLTLAATPARHFSGRGLFDGDETLWSSWVIGGPTRRVVFSGDTGMSAGFAEIGRRYGPFDATLIETGGYSEFWPDVHLGPEQAVQAHQNLRGGLLVPIHWGTFSMALHAWTEPVERLLVAAAAARVAVVISRPGQSIEPAAPPANDRWWPALAWQRAGEAPVVSSGTADAVGAAASGSSAAPNGAVRRKAGIKPPPQAPEQQ